MIKAKFQKESFAKGENAKVQTSIEVNGTFGAVMDELIMGIVQMTKEVLKKLNFREESYTGVVRLLIDTLEDEFLENKENQNG